jgi:hypothetical protein
LFVELGTECHKSWISTKRLKIIYPSQSQLVITSILSPH